MLRRDMLKGMAAVVALQPDFLFRVAANAAAASSRVRPGDAAWPSAASWARLNEAVGGNLIAAPAPFRARDRSQGRALRRRRREYPESILPRRPPRRPPRFRPAR